MNYYKNNDGKVYAYDESQTPIDGLTLMTTAEVEEHINPQPTPHEITSYIPIYRKERESELVSNGSGDNEITVIPNLRTMFTLETLDNAGNGVSAYSAENGTFDMTATQVTNLNNACKLHIAKLFIAQGAVKSAHTTTPYTTIAAIETAFDNAYNS